MAKTFLRDAHTSEHDGLQQIRHLLGDKRIFLLGYLVVLSCVGHAFENAPDGKNAMPNLPELGGQPTDGPEYIGINAQSIAVGAHRHAKTWGAQVDGYQGVQPSLQIEQGWVVNEKLGAGGTYSVGKGYSEVLINGVFAPDRSLRVQLTAGQMRSKKNFLSAPADEPQAVLQTGYLLDMQKKWKNDHVLSEAGIVLYTANAASAGPARLAPLTDSTLLQGNNGNSGRLATGTLGGYMLNLAVQPTYRSDIGLIYKRDRVVYHFAGSMLTASTHAFAGINYRQSFRDCSRFDGSISKSPALQQVSLHFEKDSWNVSILRTRSAGHSDTSLQVGYSIPLGGPDEKATKCKATPDASPTFEAVIDATTARPNHLPKEPLAKADTEMRADVDAIP
jgi:hypothetical protein